MGRINFVTQSPTSTLEMEIILMKHFDIKKNLIVHNVSDRSTLIEFESDLLVLSTSGYATTIEIKVSKADLKNDLKKKHIKLLKNPVYRKRIFKRYYTPFKYFYYAVPYQMKKEALKQIPSFCGLLVIKEVPSHKYGTEKIVIEEKSPLFLFNTKWTDLMRYKLARLGAMRILNLKQNILHEKAGK